MIPLVRGDRTGIELDAESDRNGLELWQSSVRLNGDQDWQNSMRKANKLLNTTFHVSIEPKEVSAHSARMNLYPHKGVKASSTA